jgi:hypothetical protein
MAKASRIGGGWTTLLAFLPDPQTRIEGSAQGVSQEMILSSIIKGKENYGRPASLFSAGGYSGL